MGRKIPGKKHKRIKDPEQQQLIRFDSIKNKINAPPSNPDDQEIPKSLQAIMDYRERVKNIVLPGKSNRRKKKLKLLTLGPAGPKFKKGDQNTSNFNQRKGETDRNFMQRVNEMVSTVLKESKYEDKYKVKVLRNYESGEVENVVKQPRKSLDKMITETKMLRSGKKDKLPDEAKPSKSQKRRMKIAEKKEKQLKEDVKDFDKFTDTVKFGDVAHAPPNLTTPKKMAKTNSASRPGQKDLLLKSVLQPNEKKSTTQLPTRTKKTVFQKIENEKIDKSGKRKDLPNALRRQLEKQQKEAINAYKVMKAKKK